LQEEANAERVIAFHTYEDDLRARLDLAKTQDELTARWTPNAASE
jgi:hypothetical protein